MPRCRRREEALDAQSPLGDAGPQCRDAYAVNDVTAEHNADGSVTVHFGGDESAENYIPITPGWSYLLRLYRPRNEILDGSWSPPEAQPLD